MLKTNFLLYCWVVLVLEAVANNCSDGETILDALQARNDLSLAQLLFERADLNHVLSNKTMSLTIQIPSNAAVEELDKGYLQKLLSHSYQADLTEHMRYHIYDNDVNDSSETVTTLQGQELHLSQHGVWNHAGFANAMETMAVCNGRINVIRRMLTLPPVPSMPPTTNAPTIEPYTDTTEWNQMGASLFGSISSMFGQDVAISKDGKTIAALSRLENCQEGSYVHAYRFNDEGMWQPLGAILGGVAIDDIGCGSDQVGNANESL